MDPRSPEPAFRRVLGAAANIVPIATASAATVVAFQLVPDYSREALAVVGLTWATLVGGLVARRLGRPASPQLPEQPQTTLIDIESGLGNARQLEEVLHREIARSIRYGDRTALAVVEVQVANFQPLTPDELPPSPARFIARTLVNALRDSDAVLRLDRTRFVGVLAECDEEGGEKLIARLRTHLSTTPYARNHDGSGIYARAWASLTPWDPAYRDPETYLRAGLAKLDETRSGYEAAQTWFSGQFAADRRQAPPRTRSA